MVEKTYDKDGLYALLRYGNRNSGSWDDCAGDIPHSDWAATLAHAPTLRTLVADAVTAGGALDEAWLARARLALASIVQAEAGTEPGYPSP